MPYYTKVIQPGEHVKYVGRLHWIIYRSAIVFSGALVSIAYLISRFQALPGKLEYVLLATSILCVAAFARPWFIRVTSEIVVTDRRIIHKIGWIARQTNEMNMAKVETVEVDQGVIGRALGFGSVIIKGTGASWEPLRLVANPIDLRNAVLVG